MTLNPDMTQAAFEAGSACFGLLNVRAIRASRSIKGVHWLPTAFFALWGLYNLWFYAALHLPLAWWAGLGITLVNAAWLGHVAWYLGNPWVRYHYHRRQVFKLLARNIRSR